MLAQGPQAIRGLGGAGVWGQSPHIYPTELAQPGKAAGKRTNRGAQPRPNLPGDAMRRERVIERECETCVDAAFLEGILAGRRSWLRVGDDADGQEVQIKFLPIRGAAGQWRLSIQWVTWRESGPGQDGAYQPGQESA